MQTNPKFPKFPTFPIPIFNCPFKKMKAILFYTFVCIFVLTYSYSVKRFFLVNKIRSLSIV